MGYKGDKSAARPPEGSLVETRCLKGPKSAIVPFAEPRSGPKSRTGSGVSSAKDVPWNLGVNLRLVQRIKNELDESNGYDEGTATRMFLSNYSGKKRTPDFFGETPKAIIDNNPYKSIRSTTNDTIVSCCA